jgi:hypothetical protein
VSPLERAQPISGKSPLDLAEKEAVPQDGLSGYAISFLERLRARSTCSTDVDDSSVRLCIACNHTPPGGRTQQSGNSRRPTIHTRQTPQRALQ